MNQRVTPPTAAQKMMTLNARRLIAPCIMLLVAWAMWWPMGLYLFELSLPFAPYFCVLFLTVAAWSVFRAQYLTAASGLFFSTVIGLLFVPVVWPNLRVADADLKVVQANVFHHNAAIDKAIEVLLQTEADVIAVQEISTAWSEKFCHRITKQYPYSVVIPHDTCCYGIALFSRHPIMHHEVLQVEGAPQIVADVQLGGETVRVIVVHTLPPAFPDQTAERNEQLRQLTQTALASEHPTILLGDLNIVPWDRTFQVFLEAADLHQVQNGFQPTWPMDLGFPLIPIDLVTHSERFIPTSCEAVTVPGSDHRGLVVGFEVSES